MLPLFLKVPAAQAALDMKTVPLILYAGIFSSVLLSTSQLPSRLLREQPWLSPPLAAR